MSVKIIADSTSDFSIQEAEKLGIELVPLKVSFGDEEYIDKFTITNRQFYEKLKSSDVMPTTAQVSPQRFLDVYAKYPSDDIVGIFLSHNLSGTYQSAMIAKEESGRKNVYPVDSASVTVGEALVVKQAIRLRDEGLSGKEIYEKINLLAKKVEMLAILDTLKYLVKGGRLSSTKGFVGNMLGIKPIVSVKDGIISQYGQKRGMRNALDSAVRDIRALPDYDPRMPVGFSHADNMADVDYLRTHFRDGDVFDMGSVVGTHGGPRAIAIAYFRR
jgi:DegV family protein with EDD domain